VLGLVAVVFDALAGFAASRIAAWHVPARSDRESHW
jgi:hypothetical protein